MIILKFYVVNIVAADDVNPISIELIADNTYLPQVAGYSLVEYDILSCQYKSALSSMYTLHTGSPVYSNHRQPSTVYFAHRQPGAGFNTDFSLTIRIQWKRDLVLIQSLGIRSQQSFAHVTTAQLSFHVQNFAAITLLESRWEQNEMSNLNCDG